MSWLLELTPSLVLDPFVALLSFGASPLTCMSGTERKRCGILPLWSTSSVPAGKLCCVMTCFLRSIVEEYGRLLRNKQIEIGKEASLECSNEEQWLASSIQSISRKMRNGFSWPAIYKEEVWGKAKLFPSKVIPSQCTDCSSLMPQHVYFVSNSKEFLAS